MKRNENLIPLSRDHHFGLLCSWKIREGVKKGIAHDRILKFLNSFWDGHLGAHFALEDEALPPIFDNGLYDCMANEHKVLKNLVKCINESDSTDLLLDFEQALQSHIRFEERVIFPYYEENLSADKLRELGNKISENHHAHLDT